MVEKDDAFAWMPLYWRDLFADTMHLTTLEFGAYMKMIGRYWMTRRPLANVESELLLITGLKASEWRRVSDRILSLFVSVDAGWSHKRIERELAKARKRSEHGKGAASRRWDARAMPEQCPSNAPASLGHMPGACETQPQTETQQQQKKPGLAADPLPELPMELDFLSDAWKRRLAERREMKSKGRQTPSQVASQFKQLAKVVEIRGREYALFCVERAIGGHHQGIVFQEDLVPVRGQKDALRRQSGTDEERQAAYKNRAIVVEIPS